MFSNSERQGLKSLDEFEGIERTESSSNIPEQLYPYFDYEGNVPKSWEITNVAQYFNP